MIFHLDKSKWTRVEFGDIVENVNENSKNPVDEGITKFIGLDHLDNGELKVRRFGDTSEGVTFRKIVSPGQTLFGKRRAYQRKVAFSDFRAVCSGDILTFSPKSDSILDTFLPFLVMSDSFFDKALATSAGSLSPRTRWSDLAKFSFLLPPLDVQKDIADLFWSIETSLEAKQNLSEILNKTLSSCILEEVANCKTDALLPNVAEVLDSQRVPVNTSDRNLRGGDVPYYGAGGQVGWIDRAIFNEDLVLVGEDATLDVYRISGPSWVNNHAHVLRPKIASQDWLYYVLSTMNLKSVATNGTRLKLTQAALNSIRIPMPSNMNQTVNRIREIEHAIQGNFEVIEKEMNLKSNLLNHFFGGA